MDALGIETAIVAGFDWGARTADIVAALWPERCSGARLGERLPDRQPGGRPGCRCRRRPSSSGGTSTTSPPSAAGPATSKYRREFAKLIWRTASPKWNFDDATFERSAASFDNPDHVAIVIHNYRWRLGLADGEPEYDELETAARRRPASSPCRRSRSRATPTARRIPSPSAYAGEVLGPVRAPDDRGRHRAQPAPGGAGGVRRRGPRRSATTDVSLSAAAATAGQLPVEGRLPGFDGATGWLNSPPLTPADLRGQGRARRLLDVHLHQLAAHARLRPRLGREVRAITGWSWSASTRPSSRSSATSTTSAGPRRRCDVEYPVALDSDYAVWQRLRQPLLAGRLHRRRRGTDPATTTSARAAYDECERVDPAAAARGRTRRRSATTSSPSLREGVEAQADWANLESPETYLGYEQGRSFASPGGAALDEPRTYAAPDALGAQPVGARRRLDDRAASERARTGADGRIAFRFHARDVNLVMGPRARGASVPFRVLVDGEPPGAAHGLDVDERRPTGRSPSRGSTS